MRPMATNIHLCSSRDWLTLLIRESHRGGHVMDTQASSASPDGGPAIQAPLRKKPATSESPPSRDGSPSFDVEEIKGPVPVAWREGTLTRANELEALHLWVRPGGIQGNDQVLANAIQRHLKAARQAAQAVPLHPSKPFASFAMDHLSS